MTSSRVCAYESDNDVCDNQVVNMQFANGVTASFTMIAFTEDICERKTRIFASEGQIDADGILITTYNFKTGKTTVYHPTASTPPGTTLHGHSGADW